MASCTQFLTIQLPKLPCFTSMPSPCDPPVWCTWFWATTESRITQAPLFAPRYMPSPQPLVWWMWLRVT
ncbi:MAG: hypothetical protein HY812_11945 [Planctomycetes bacterium]|nr:hypothetical protein [Planctomycetota bacterium]